MYLELTHHCIAIIAIAATVHVVLSMPNLNLESLFSVFVVLEGAWLAESSPSNPV